MTTTTERATCPVCQTPDVQVNPSGSLRKHPCTPAAPSDSPPDAAKVAPTLGGLVEAHPTWVDVPMREQTGETAVPPDGAAPSPIAVITTDEPLTEQGAVDLHAAVTVAPDEEGRRYCKRPNCGRKPHRHGWCEIDHMLYCEKG